MIWIPIPPLHTVFINTFAAAILINNMKNSWPVLGRKKIGFECVGGGGVWYMVYCNNNPPGAAVQLNSEPTQLRVESTEPNRAHAPWLIRVQSPCAMRRYDLLCLSASPRVLCGWRMTRRDARPRAVWASGMCVYGAAGVGNASHIDRHPPVRWPNPPR